MKQGKVWLVGAGPGDAGLLTRKGQRVLEQAEVVVCDRLIGAVASLIPPQAERIDVGKAAGRHSVPQEEINRILLTQAQQGKRVVRLKGGDPFLFGRGGEELALLHQHGVPFEVVPGVPSAIAVPAYQGIPVTHRDLASSLHIITAHKKAGSPLPLDFSLLAKLEGTLVFLMGVSALEEICGGLIGHGKAADTPAAILENGTRYHQRRVVSTLAELPAQAREQGIGAPAVIVVGEVCALARQFDWAAQRPLQGARVIVTQSAGRSGRLAEKLEDLGAEVCRMPAIETVLLEGDPQWQAAREKLPDYDWLVFSSPTAASCFFALLRRERIDLRSLRRAKFAAVGPATAKAIEEHGVLTAYCPPVYDGEALGKGLAERMRPGETALAFQPAHTESAVVQSLRAHGAAVTACPIYRVVEATRRAPLEDGMIAAFTSAACVRGFRQVTLGQDITGLPAVCIGEKTAAQARQFGMAASVAKEATLDSLIEQIKTVHREGKRSK